MSGQTAAKGSAAAAANKNAPKLFKSEKAAQEAAAGKAN